MNSLTNPAGQRLCSIEDLIRKLNGISQARFGDVQGVLDIVSASQVSSESLAPYLTWDKQHYTRNLIYKTDRYALMAICWEPGQASSIHNHQNQNCWMAVPVGRLLVQNYRVLFQDIHQGKCALENADTLEMNVAQPAAVDPFNPVHRVYNPAEFNQRAVSLHVYSTPFDDCVVYSQEKGTCGIIDLRYTTEYGHMVGQASRLRPTPFRT